VHAEDQHRTSGELLLHVAKEIEAAAARHREIEDRHVPLDLARKLERFVAIRGFPHHGGRRIVRQHLLEAVTHNRVVVGNEDSHKFRSPLVSCPESKLPWRRKV
jgi:hypothetical protein